MKSSRPWAREAWVKSIAHAIHVWGRDVAVKVLPSDFSADGDRPHRFEQEACAAGALNHPNILSIYDVGTHDGTPYVVSELLEGDTLRQRLAGATLARRRVIDYTLQIVRPNL